MGLKLPVERKTGFVHNFNREKCRLALINLNSYIIKVVKHLLTPQTAPPSKKILIYKRSTDTIGATVQLAMAAVEAPRTRVMIVQGDT